MQTTLYQLELNQDNIDCGMSYVFHMKDGRFFIIDGGYFTDGEDDRLYDFLKSHCDGGDNSNNSNNSNKKPVIAGWFFSHAHQDHMGAFISFIWKYRNDVVIENLMYNFQHVDFSSVTGDWKSSDPATVKEFYRTVEEYCSDVQTITTRTGDVFNIGEIEIEVLYTHEDLYPIKSSFNDCSTVITTKVDGQKILWTGDIYIEASRILLENKKDELVCDIVQISHHGFTGATKDLYAATHAKAALWPTPDYIFERIKQTTSRERFEDDVNFFLMNEMDIKEHIFGGHGTAKLSLPYQIGTYTKEPKKFFSAPDRYKKYLPNTNI